MAYLLAKKRRTFLVKSNQFLDCSPASFFGGIYINNYNRTKFINEACFIISNCTYTSTDKFVEFIKAKYMVRRSAKVAVIPIRRSFFKGDSTIQWRTYPGELIILFRVFVTLLSPFFAFLFCL